MRLAATSDGRLTAFEHIANAQTSRLNEFCEPCDHRDAACTPRRTGSTRIASCAWTLPSPGFCRAPGEAPASFAVESALDELALTCGVDPVELRIRNEPAEDPSDALPFSSRGLVDCLRHGADTFGWWTREPVRRGRVLVGHGVASSMYPTFQLPSSARVTASVDGTFRVDIGAADVGTGSRTVLAQIAADELGVDVASVAVELGDSSLPYAIGAFASLGTSSWGHAVVLACRDLRRQLDESGGAIPDDGLVGFGDSTSELEQRKPYSRHAYGAQFAEVSVDADTGEVRVTRLLGVFAAGRIVDPRLARSQALGGMTWGISMALHEHAVMDLRDGDFVTKDLASYHVPVAADIPDIDVVWLDEVDEQINPVGSKGIGEIGIVGDRSRDRERGLRRYRHTRPCAPADARQAHETGGRAMTRIDMHAHVFDVGPPLPQGRTSAGFADLLAHMDAWEVDGTVVSPGAPPPGTTDLVTWTRRKNEELAGAVRRHPRRLGAVAALPLPDVDAALAEIQHAYQVLDLDGIALLTNYEGVYLGDPRLDPVFDELQRRGAYCYVHPDFPPAWPLPDHPGRWYEYPFDTTRAMVNLALSGTFDRCPDVRMLWAI